jgi:hypothetical protein
MTTRGRVVSETLRRIIATFPKPKIPDCYEGDLQSTLDGLAKEWKRLTECKDRNPETHEKVEV